VPARLGTHHQDHRHETDRNAHAGKHHGAHDDPAARLVQKLVEVLGLHAGGRGQEDICTISLGT
jgi:hypothetical protein